MDNERERYATKRTPFGEWLIGQRDAGGFIGGLASAAALDRSFPRQGDVEAARQWLQRSRASGDDWEALEDADSAWQRQCA